MHKKSLTQSWRTWANCSLCCSRENHCGVWFVLCCSIIWLSKTWLVGISKGRPFCLLSLRLIGLFRMGIEVVHCRHLIPSESRKIYLNSTYLFSKSIHERHLSRYSDSYLYNWLPNIYLHWSFVTQDRSNLLLITSWRMLHKFSTYLDPMYLVIDTQFPSNKYGTYLV